VIVSVATGRKGSKGFPDKHFCDVEGEFLSYYPMAAAFNCSYIDKNYISTDDERLMEAGRDLNFEVIKRPYELCTDSAISEDVFIHAYNTIKERNEGESIDILVLLMCNAPMITSETITKGIDVLNNNPEYDSAATVSEYNQWGPIRARKIGEDGLLYPCIPFDLLGDQSKFNCDRNSAGDVWFVDNCVAIVRPRCIENMKDGLPPQRWMGKKIYPLTQVGSFDLDYERDLPLVKGWIKKYWK